LPDAANEKITSPTAHTRPHTYKTHMSLIKSDVCSCHVLDNKRLVTCVH